AGVALAPFRPANMGFRVGWSERMARHFGAPVKALALTAGGRRVRGEVVLSRRGIEGGGIYALYREIRDGAALTLDLIPDIGSERAAARLARRRPGASLGEHLRRALGLDPVRRALAMEFGQPLPADPATLATRLKALPVPLAGPRPIDEAISTAGGIAWEGLDERLMIRALPGVFAAGEMIDWEAPTGGYLITGCLATGRLAGLGAADWLDQRPG
ncbi:MAG: TIGR03862 family flavoprotein, partial [Pseudomonadota bacterium]